MTALCRRCGREYAEVHVEGYPVTLYGHLRPPTPSHPVRLSRPADDDHGLGTVGSRRLTEAPVTVAPVPGASSDPVATRRACDAAAGSQARAT